MKKLIQYIKDWFWYDFFAGWLYSKTVMIIFTIICLVLLSFFYEVIKEAKEKIKEERTELIELRRANQHLKSENTFLKKSLEYEDKRLLKN